MTALSDVRILDLSRLLPGGFCTLLLADLGADVIKVEDTDSGDYLRWMGEMVDEYAAMFHAMNRNKRSVALNLKTDAGRAAFLDLVATADVVLESFRPGVLQRLRLGYDTLAERNPAVVLCSITGYGQDGPYESRAGHDLNYAALSGALSVSGECDGLPAMPGLQAGDLGAGALHAAVAILAALHQREQTGRGQHCDIAMLDGLVGWMAYNAATVFAGGVLPRAGQTLLNGRYPCYRVYRCADGAVSVAALEPKFWTALVAALGLAHLGGDGFAEGAEGARVAAEVQSALMGRTRAELAELGADADVCCEPVLDVSEVFAHPQVIHRGMEIPAGAAGPVAQVACPIRLSDSPATLRRGAPAWGGDTRDVLREAGYDTAAINALATEGAIR
ncbi:MAG TPA: CaiB/BaiF CoA-transferase family protein [Candidatus Dormibacteraeota bacterium]